MAAEWSYLLADLLTGAITAEVPLSGVSISKKLNDAGSMSGTWVLSPYWTGGSPATLTMPCRTMGIALRDGRPMFAGILWTCRRSSGSPNLALGFADLWSYFDHRKVLPLLVPDGTTSQVSALSTTYMQVEQNEIARQLVAQAQAYTAGNLNIVADTTNSGILRDRTYAGHELVDVGTALKQLAEVIDGPDMMFEPATELDANGRVVNRLRIGNPTLGQTGSSVVFEYPGPILAYEWNRDGSKMATRQYATGEGIEAGALVAIADNGPIYADGWPLLEAESTYSSVNQDDTLQEHADADLQRNRLPVVTPSLTVVGDGLNARGQKVSAAIGEYNCGDQIRVVIQDDFFQDRLDSTFRIVALDLRPGDDGVETCAVSVNPVFDLA